MRLDELCLDIVDCEHKTAPISAGGGYFAVGTPAMQGNRINFVEAREISQETFHVWTKRMRPAEGDLLFAREAPVGPVVRIPSRLNVAPGQRTVLLRPNPSVTDSRFLYYAIAAPSTQRRIQDLSMGSTVAHLNVADVRSFELPVPTLAEQRAIAEVLGVLDDKIAANSKLVTTTDELSQAVYAANRSSSASLVSLASFVNGRNFTKDATGTGRVVVRISELNSGLGNSTVLNDLEAPDDNLANPGDILFAWSGSLTVKRWTLPSALINQHIFKVLPTGDLPHWLAYQALLTKLREFKAIAADKATTMGHIQRRHLEVDVPVPTDEEMARINPLMQGLWDRGIAAEQESQTLAELRDTLLPALMDGTIRVKDAVAHMEGVL